MFESITKYVGNIENIRMPYQDIYYIEGKDIKAYVVPSDYQGEIISEKALKVGVPVDDCLCFFQYQTFDCIEYEILDYQLRSTDNLLAKKYIEKEKKEIEIFGHFGRKGAVQYFGNVPLIEYIDDKKVTDRFVLAKGIQLCCCDNIQYFCAYKYYGSLLNNDVIEKATTSNDFYCFTYPKWKKAILKLLDYHEWEDDEKDAAVNMLSIDIKEPGSDK